MLKNAKKGFAASKAAQKAIQSSVRRMTPMLFIKKTDTKVPVYFNGQNDEPLMVDIHDIKYFKKNGEEGYETTFCGMEEHGECEGCDRAAAGDKRVSPRKKAGAFSVVDLRWYGKTQSDREFNGEKQYFFDAIPVEKADPFEAAPDRVKVGSKVYNDIVRQPKSLMLLLSNVRVLALGAEEEDVGLKCRSCNKGKISLEGYKVGKKVIPEDDYDPEIHEDAVKQFSCTKCDDAEPWTIFSLTPTNIRRSGEGKSTTYAFALDKAQDMENMDWATELKPVDLEEATAATGASRYEKILGPNKNGSSKEKEVEEESEGDEEEDSLYNKESDKEASSEKKKKKLKLKVSKKG